MKIKNKPYAISMIDSDGFMALACKTKTQAIIEIQEAWNDDKEYNEQEYGKVIFTEENIKEERAFRCPDCGMNWIDERHCSDCDRSVGGIGRKVFSYYHP